MNGRPSKPLALVKKHLTKAEREVREKAEAKLYTGVAMQEWPEVKNNKLAHKHYMRTKRLLKAINKDDALHEPTINRYCMLLAECSELEQMMQAKNEQLRLLKVKYEQGEMELENYFNLENSMTNTLLTIDKEIMSKRKMLLDIEKENIMTIQSALRSIPKKPEEEKEESGLSALLSGGKPK